MAQTVRRNICVPVQCRLHDAASSMLAGIHASTPHTPMLPGPSHQLPVRRRMSSSSMSMASLQARNVHYLKKGCSCLDESKRYEHQARLGAWFHTDTNRHDSLPLPERTWPPLRRARRAPHTDAVAGTKSCSMMRASTVKGLRARSREHNGQPRSRAVRVRTAAPDGPPLGQLRGPRPRAAAAAEHAAPHGVQLGVHVVALQRLELALQRVAGPQLRACARHASGPCPAPATSSDCVTTQPCQPSAYLRHHRTS
jgi:hypothetical protein